MAQYRSDRNPADLVFHDPLFLVGDLAAEDAGPEPREPDRVETLTVLSTPTGAGMAAGFRAGEQHKHSWYMAAFALPLVPVPVGSPPCAMKPGITRWNLMPL